MIALEDQGKKMLLFIWKPSLELQDEIGSSTGYSLTQKWIIKKQGSCSAISLSHPTPPEMQLIMVTSSTPQSSDLDKVHLDVW